jgi:hypothetical protein
MPYADDDDQMLAILHVDIVVILHARMDLKRSIDRLEKAWDAIQGD